MLTLENLSFDVNDEKGEIGIIKDISFTVDDGKFVVITGPNGGGKSTTAKLDVYKRQEVAREIAEFCGFSQGMTYSFESPKVFDRMLIPEAVSYTHLCFVWPSCSGWLQPTRQRAEKSW